MKLPCPLGAHHISLAIACVLAYILDLEWSWYFSFSFIWVRYANPVQKITFPNFNGSELSAKSVDGMMARWKVWSLPFFCSLYVSIYLYYICTCSVTVCFNMFVWWKARHQYFKIGFSNWIWFWDPEIDFKSPKVGFQASWCNVFQLDSWWGRRSEARLRSRVLRVRLLDYRGNGNCHISSFSGSNQCPIVNSEFFGGYPPWNGEFTSASLHFSKFHRLVFYCPHFSGPFATGFRFDGLPSLPSLG